MVFGGVPQERIALNEDTLWSGYPRDWNNPAAPKSLPRVRKLVLEDKDYHGADEESHKMQGPFNQNYEPLGDLLIDFDHSGDVTGYRRELDLDSAIATTSYEVDGCRYTREIFASHPSQLIIMRLKSSEKGRLDFGLRWKSQLQASSAPGETNQVILKGKAPSQSDPNYKNSPDPVQYDGSPGKGMYFASVLEVHSNDGHLEQHDGGTLSIQHATAVVLLIGMATGYRGYSVLPDRSAAEVIALASRPIASVRNVSYEQLRKDHITDYRALYRRVELNLSEKAGVDTPPTDERVKQHGDSIEPSLLMLYFNYSRYLLIASSRVGSQPANLQGIWNEEVRPPWSSNWTSNINVQMNYWHAETSNLAECHLPLFEMTRELSVNGRITAQTNYGAPGWVSHHNIDLWRQSGAVGDYVAAPTWANFAMSGPWLCAHLWEHYLFSKDPVFLREMAYPIMKGSAEFCLSWLIDDGNGGLTTCPSVSTENLFLAKDGKAASVSAGCTLDLNFIRELFGNVVQAAELLNLDVAFASRLHSALQKLPPYKVGRFGQLQEWSDDFAENEPGHRHMSHLYGIYPGAQITPHRQANFMEPARKSLERRLAHGGGATGWSCLWAICLWARFCDGNMALNSLRKLLQTNTGINLFNIDFWDKKYLFQIDANLGAAGAIAEMLLQSHDGEVAFLPALPNAWREGFVHGLRARGALEVSMSWKGGAIFSASVRALRGGHHVFCAPKGQRITRVELKPQRQPKKIPFKAGENGRAEFEVTADRSYNFYFSQV
jgi:alpha-L-fucosidase 2